MSAVFLCYLHISITDRGRRLTIVPELRLQFSHGHGTSHVRSFGYTYYVQLANWLGNRHDAVTSQYLIGR